MSEFVFALTLTAFMIPACADERAMISGDTQASGQESSPSESDASSSEASDGSAANPEVADEPQAGTNSNACLADMGLLQPVCPTGTGLEPPSVACCNAFKKFQEDSCACSPLIKTIMGEDERGVAQLDKLVGGLTVLCPTLDVALPTPDCSGAVALSGINSGQARTYNGGTCELSDAEIDDLRFESVTGFKKVMQDFGAQTEGCVDIKRFTGALGRVFDADSADGKSPFVLVPYGIGRYATLNSIAEYLGMSIPAVTRDAFRVLVADYQTEQSALYFAPDGTRIIAGNHGYSRAYKDCATAAEGYYEQTFSFVGCSTTMHSMKISTYSQAPSPPSEGGTLAGLVRAFYNAATTNTWGVIDICKYHERFCTGGNKQFESFDACLAFMRALPVISPACGEAGVLGGNSLMCRFKHHFMIPFEPEAHCFHIGMGHQDVYGHAKCLDAECSDPDILGPPELLSLGMGDAEAACLDAADAVSTPAGEIPAGPWPTATVCP